MPFIPHTEEEISEMLAAIGASSIDALFDEIPQDLLIRDLDGVPEALSEMEISSKSSSMLLAPIAASISLISSSVCGIKGIVKCLRIVVYSSSASRNSWYSSGLIVSSSSPVGCIRTIQPSP